MLNGYEYDKRAPRREAFLGGSGENFVVVLITSTYFRPFGGTFFRILYHVTCKEKIKDTQIILFLFIYFYHLSLHFVTFITTMVYRGPQNNFHEVI